MTEAKLMEVLDFTDADLASNRLGRLTQKQNEMLAEMAKKHKSFNMTIGVVIAVMVGCPLIIGLVSPILSVFGGSLLQGGDFTPAALLPSLPFLCMGLFFFVIFGGIILLVLKLIFDRANRKVDTEIRRAEGTVNFVWVERRERHTSGKSSSYRTVRALEMRVGAENTFNNVDSRLPSLINQGDEWVFYYTNHPFKFLSAEKVK